VKNGFATVDYSDQMQSFENSKRETKQQTERSLFNE
jgi:hypothetical protein